ncbi:Alpha/Beta hydrolase protein [Xylariales sp. PMI_506]|nr:Alpha/Beta hydrolase protein [Xylariales sp. PMI_506]
MTSAPKPTIVLIHGLWMTPLCWEDWINHFESKGYEVIAPGWPGIDDRTVEDIREDPSPMAKDSISSIVEHYTRIITALPTPPIIMGHSVGGLFVQILLSNGLGKAGIAISPAQPAGIFSLPWSTIKATLPVLGNPINLHKAVPITAEQFHYAFGSHTTREASDKLWQKYSVPIVAHVLFQDALGSKEAKVEFHKKNRAPLLLIAGSADHVIAASTVEKEFKAYGKGIPSDPVVELKIFEGRSHGIVNQDGWEEVADTALSFAETYGK